MKKMMLILLCIMLLSCIASGMRNPDYEFRVAVMGQSYNDVEVYGIFMAEEGKYGGIELAFYDGNIAYSLRTIKDLREMEDPADKSSLPDRTDNLRLIVKLFIKPIAESSDKITLSSQMITMINTKRRGEPSFNISRVFFERDVSVGGKTVISVPTDPGEESIMLELETFLAGRTSDNIILDTLSLDARYSLYDETNRRYDVKDEKCRLSYDPAATHYGQGCTHSKTYYLDNGDSLLYMVQYKIEDLESDNGKLTGMTLYVQRYYIMNPMNYYMNLPAGDDDDTSGTGSFRTISTEKSINGKKRNIHAVIDKGRVIEFEMNDVRFLDKDIIANWGDIVTILRQVETTGKYKYLPPRLNRPYSKDGDSTNRNNLLNNPDNYTGDFVKTSAFSKAITFNSSKEIKIEIKFDKDSYLPFLASESITLYLP